MAEKPMSDPYHEYQSQLLDLVYELDRLKAKALQLAANSPGGKQIDVPGAKPQRKPPDWPQNGLFQEKP